MQQLRTPEDVAQFALMVEVTRTAKGHALNERSSRSHCLVHLVVTARAGGGGGGGVVTKRHLLFVDLAGSERILKTGVEGEGKKQAVAINSSLSALGKVIRALADQAGVPSGQGGHVPYRDSTLTMLLRGSLSGRACTSVVINVAPDAAHADESVCSLQFGARMASVVSRAVRVVGSDAGGEAAALAAELRAARQALAALAEAGHGERFSAAAAAHEVRSFQENQRRAEDEEAAARRARVRLAELRAKAGSMGGGGGGGGGSGGGGGGGGGDTEIAAVAASAEAHAAEAANYRDIVLRQKSIKGFYVAPKAGYLAKAAAIRHIEAQLGQLLYS
jgi:hypothetical protein